MANVPNKAPFLFLEIKEWPCPYVAVLLGRERELFNTKLQIILTVSHYSPGDIAFTIYLCLYTSGSLSSLKGAEER